MFSRFVAVVSMIFFVAAQMPPAYSQSSVPPTAAPSGPAAVPAAVRSVTVPAGTSIPLTLINPIRSKTSKPGDAVRATVAFPVTAGSDVAIPAGSYAEGTIQLIDAKATSSAPPQVKIHFTRLLFANGYSVPLDAENTQSELNVPDLNLPDAAVPKAESAAMTERQDVPAPVETAQAHLVRTSYGMGSQQQPTPPPLPPLPPMPGPSPAVVAGAALGGLAALTIGMFALAHHRAANLDYVVYDSGWQFQIVLEQPLTIDASRIPATTAMFSSN